MSFRDTDCLAYQEMDVLRHHDVGDDRESVLNSKLLDRTLADIAVGGTCQKRLPFVTAEGDEV